MNFQGNFSELLLKKSPEPCVHPLFSIYEDLATRSPHNNIEDSKYANMHFEYCSYKFSLKLSVEILTQKYLFDSFLIFYTFLNLVEALFNLLESF